MCSQRHRNIFSLRTRSHSSTSLTRLVVTMTTVMYVGYVPHDGKCSSHQYPDLFPLTPPPSHLLPHTPSLTHPLSSTFSYSPSPPSLSSLPLLPLLPTLSQVLHTYLEDESIEVDNETAVKLGCLELRRFYKDMPQIALKKRENFTILE